MSQSKGKPNDQCFKGGSCGILENRLFVLPDGKVTLCEQLYMAILQCRKTVHTDEGKQRQAALLAFSAFPELKHVILVDEEDIIDIFSYGIVCNVVWM